jgi:uncharacterized membrane protein YagU involved in acid resistance
MTRHDTPIEVALKGASAGLAGTLVLTVAMRAVAELIASLPRSQTEPRGSQDGVAPPAQLVGKIAQGLFERDLPPAVQSVLGQTLHWTYGAVWGVVYGIVQGSVGLPAALHGSVLGLIVWLVGPLGLVPALRLSSQASPRARPQLLRSLMFHQVYGWAVALAFNLLTRDD